MASHVPLLNAPFSSVSGAVSLSPVMAQVADDLRRIGADQAPHRLDLLAANMVEAVFKNPAPYIGFEKWRFHETHDGRVWVSAKILLPRYRIEYDTDSAPAGQVVSDIVQWSMGSWKSYKNATRKPVPPTAGAPGHIATV